PAGTADLGVGYSYDACGKLVSRGAQALAYDHLNRLVRVDQAGQTLLRCAYDGLGQRVKRVDAGGTTHYAGRHYERTVAGGVATITKHYYAALGGEERLVGFRRGGVLRYADADHLGSTALVLDAGLVVRREARRRPFGAEGVVVESW